MPVVRLFRLFLVVPLLVPLAGTATVAEERPRLPPRIVDDGRVTMAELAAHSQAVFRALDSDGDGLIARREFVAFPLTPAATLTETDRGALFDAIDDDGNGAIHRGEWEIAIRYGAQLADLDRDGHVSLAELVAMNKAGTLGDAIPPGVLIDGLISGLF